MIYESRWEWWAEGGCWRLLAVSFLTALTGEHGSFNEKCFSHRLGSLLRVRVEPSGGRTSLEETCLWGGICGFLASLFSFVHTHTHTLPVWKSDQSACLAFPDVMDSRPRQPRAKTSSFFLNLLGIMIFNPINRKVTNAEIYFIPEIFFIGGVPFLFLHKENK